MLKTEKINFKAFLINLKMMLRLHKVGSYTPAFIAVGLMMASLIQSVQASAQRRKKIVLSEFVIEGRVQKPQAFLLLQRQRVDFKGLQMKKSFVPKILKSVDKKPF